MASKDERDTSDRLTKTFIMSAIKKVPLMEYLEDRQRKIAEQEASKEMASKETVVEDSRGDGTPVISGNDDAKKEKEPNLENPIKEDSPSSSQHVTGCHCGDEGSSTPTCLQQLRAWMDATNRFSNDEEMSDHEDDAAFSDDAAEDTDCDEFELNIPSFQDEMDD